MSNTSCECSIAGFCSRRNATIPEIHFKKCQSGKADIVDKIYLRDMANQAPPKRRLQKTRYGNKLAEIIARNTGEHVECSGCDNEIAKLNAMTADEIRMNAESIADGILIRGASKARTWWQRVACSFATEILKKRIVEWIKESIDGPAVVPDETWTSSKRHLTFHVYPTSHQDSWQWNLQQIAKRWDIFNGKKTIGIAVDLKTVTSNVVLEYAKSLGLRFDHVIEKSNSRTLREVMTWIPMIESLGIELLGPDDVVFSCHAKGVRHNSRESHIEAWADLMYQSCLDYMPLVDSLMQSYVSAGSFKRYGMFGTPGNNRWHYSGTFFWWKPHELFRRNWKKVDRRFFGTESWLGHHLQKDEAACLFLENCGDLYHRDYWEQEVWPKWENWKLEAAQKVGCQKD